MESGEEPTEMTSMTTGEAGVSSSDESVIVPLDGTDGSAPAVRRKSLLKLYFKSPQGRCIFAVVLATLAVLTAYVVSKLIMGLMFINACQMDPFIPIYLVVSAALFITFVIILIIIIVKCRREENDDRVSPAHLVTFVYFFIHLVLQLAGSVCVIRTRNLFMEATPDDQILDTARCDELLLTYSFGVVIFELILSGLLFIFAVISLVEVIYIECCQVKKQKKTNANR
ncbi:hypothetical protein BsWGS_23666 [Bradybaena similaris]